MRIVRMFFCGVVCGAAIFSLLCLFSVPMANAQSLEFNGGAKVKASFVETLTAAKVGEGGKLFVRIETDGDPSDCGGLQYAIWEVGEDCDLNWIGWVDTCNSNETTALGYLRFENVRKAGETIRCYFNGVVGNKALKSLGGYCWAEEEDGVDFDTLISSKFKFQAKEMNIEKKLGCTPQ